MFPNSPQRLLRAALLAAAFLTLSPADARAQFGFALNRYEPTAAGSWTFAVETPWYSRTRPFAGGLTLNYAHKPLVYGTYDAAGRWRETDVVIEHSVITHLDLAASFYDRVQVQATLPVTWLERGNDASTSGVTPIAGIAVGDLRLGALVRAWRQADSNPISIHVGASLWVPLQQSDKHQGDQTIRFLPRVILAGLARGHVRWAANVGVLIRPDAQLVPNSTTATAGSELQIGLAAGYTDLKQTFHVGPEVLYSAQVVPGRAFSLNGSSVELLFGGQYLIKSQVMVGAAIGPGFIGTAAGSPDVRLLARVAYAPVRDSDGDGIVDRDDACPKEKGPASSDPAKNGCPEPASDRDHDGVLDQDDVCPDEPMGERPDSKRHGCPFTDQDEDAVADREDLCPTVPAGPLPDPKRKGCPRDSDGDGILDAEDECIDEPMGPDPDPDHKGCPFHDRDKDSVVDPVDACPDVPGAPDPDPEKNGCPGLVQIQNGLIVILAPVYFATDKDVILQQSFPVMNAVANALKAQPRIKKVRIEGHTDSRGSNVHNLDLSQRRADSCRRYLADQGIDAERLDAQGFGPREPIATNDTAAGRAQNRRVEFHIVDPAQPTPPPAPTDKSAPAE